ncbi:MAG: NAD-dependent epimerase/dehydratase family protein [Bacteroidota bacterium]
MSTPDKPTSSPNRRQFLQTGIKASISASVLSSPVFSFAQSQRNNTLAPRHSLNILILGGTSFLGPHQIAYALNRGHSISIFTRGKTKPTIYKQLFQQVEHLVGDRNDNLEALKGRKWDAVIDNSGHRVQWTIDTAELLKDHVDLYLYTSSTGVYYPYLGDDIDESTTLVRKVPDNLGEDDKLEYNYGVMKANSELEAQKAFGEERTILVRPTYMMGPADRTDRFSYWPVRMSKGGEILVPGKANDPVQYIDVRDVAEWMIRLIETRTTGAFNAVGPATPKGMHAFVYGVQAAFAAPSSFVMIDDYDFLKQHKVPYAIPWIMPEGNNVGTARINNQKALDNGLTFTPLADSCQDIHDWWYSDAVSEERRTNLETGDRSLMAREADVLAAWKKISN